jgi:hypothetical protein
MFHNPPSPVIDPNSDTLEQDFSYWAAQHYPLLTLDASISSFCMCFASTGDECICPPAPIDHTSIHNASSSSDHIQIKQESDDDKSLSPVNIKKEPQSVSTDEAAPSWDDVPGLLESLVESMVKSQKVKRERPIIKRPVFKINEEHPDVIKFREGLFTKRIKPDPENPITQEEYRAEALACFKMKKRVGLFHFFHSYKKRYECRAEFANNRSRNDDGKWGCTK